MIAVRENILGEAHDALNFQAQNSKEDLPKNLCQFVEFVSNNKTNEASLREINPERLKK